MTQTSHLSEAALKSLISKTQDADIPGVEHLENCPHCQSRLEDFAADQWWWNDGRKLYASSAKLIQESESNLVNSGSFDPSAAEVDAIVKHFKPAIHPELMGEVDEFQVEKLIGTGGMGIVFKAFDRELNRPVAIKFLPPRLAHSGIARQRFAREAKSTAAICNDNVIPIFRINTNWIYHFFVMPYLTGGSLEQLVQREGALEADQVVQIGLQIASGLVAAHDCGLIHRDIKPSNILLENNCNRIVITDFGLVHDINETKLTQTGVIAGTPQFMSPEQVEGKSVDQKTDLFALGAVMYWMCTGHTPFQSKSQYELLRQIKEEEQQSIRSFNSRIPVGLETLINILLEKDPAKRIGSASELETLLKQYSAHLRNPIEHREPTLARMQLPPVIQKNWFAFLLLLVVTFALAIGVWKFSSTAVRWGEHSNSVATSFMSGQDLDEKDHRAITEFSLAGENNQADFEECSRVFGLVDRVAKVNPIIDERISQKLAVLYQQRKALALHVIELWKSDTQEKYGYKDLFLVEPVLVQTQLQIAFGEWPEAVQGLEYINRLLENNYVPHSMRNKVAAIAWACSQQKAGSQSAELLKRSIVELNLELSKAFGTRLD